eukprot:scaffold61224_cov36-Tisochrysis_lutea.AAC.2
MASHILLRKRLPERARPSCCTTHSYATTAAEMSSSASGPVWRKTTISMKAERASRIAPAAGEG